MDLPFENTTTPNGTPLGAAWATISHLFPNLVTLSEEVVLFLAYDKAARCISDP
jgi:hypothetical protein